MEKISVALERTLHDEPQGGGLLGSLLDFGPGQGPSGDARPPRRITHFLWKGNIDHVVSVDMPNLTLADHIFHTTKAVRLNGHTFPGGNSKGYRFLRT